MSKVVAIYSSAHARYRRSQHISNSQSRTILHGWELINVALSFPLREALMPSRSTLAAILRSTRTARGLSQEQLGGSVEARHLHNVEHAKSNITLDMLERISARLDVDPLAVLAMASCYERGEPPAAFIAHLQTEMKKLEALGVLTSLPSHFEAGNLITGKAGKRSIPSEKIQSVLACKAQGMTQKQTSLKLGMAASTVHKIWHSDSGSAVSQ